MGRFTQKEFHDYERIHQRAIDLSIQYRKIEGELIEVLEQVDLYRIYLRQGFSSLFQYVVQSLGLSESVAYNLIVVARKTREVPQLGSEISQGTITLSNARKISPVLTVYNQSHWLEKARTLSQHALEKEIAKERPQILTPERASYVTETRIKLELGLFESEMLKLRQVQDLVSQKQGRSASFEETLITLVTDYLNRHDPMERSKRVRARSQPENVDGAAESPETDTTKKMAAPVARQGKRKRKRIPVPAAIRHQVNLRDQRKCTFVLASGILCGQKRFIEIHHRIPVSEGGTHALDNLVTLCSIHHGWLHETNLDLPEAGFTSAASFQAKPP